MNNINRKKIIALLQDKKVQDYTFNILFFLIFSFFVFFAIRPNLITAFTLQKELQDIKLQSREYEEQIMQIVTYQSTLETYRNDFSLLNEAVPDNPELAHVIEDIRKNASDSGMLVKSLQVEKVNYTPNTNNEELQRFNVTAEVESSLPTLGSFFDRLISQRRLKSLDEVTISKPQTLNEELSTSNLYKINMIISSNYL